MESKWGYQLTQKADADLDNIVGYPILSGVFMAGGTSTKYCDSKVR